MGGQSFSDCGLDKITMTGALYAFSAGKQYDIGNNSAADETASSIGIDASRLNGVYSKSQTVQPLAIQIFIIIKF